MSSICGEATSKYASTSRRSSAASARRTTSTFSCDISRPVSRLELLCGRLDWLQHDHRDATTVRPALVGGVAVVVVDGVVPEPGPLVALGLTGKVVAREAPRRDEANLRVGLHVEVPLRVLGAAALGRDQHHVVAVEDVEQRDAALLAALRPGRLEHA